MPVTPVLIGKNVSFSVSPITIDSSGTVTVGTSIAMAGKADSAQMTFERLAEDIRALDANLTNFVPIVKDWRLVLSGIKRKAGTSPNPLEEVAMSSDYVQIVVTTPTKIWTFQGMIQSYDWPIAEGRNVETLTMVPIDTGTDNPTYAAPGP